MMLDDPRAEEEKDEAPRGGLQREFLGEEACRSLLRSRVEAKILQAKAKALLNEEGPARGKGLTLFFQTTDSFMYLPEVLMAAACEEAMHCRLGADPSELHYECLDRLLPRSFFLQLAPGVDAQAAREICKRIKATLNSIREVTIEHAGVVLFDGRDIAVSHIPHEDQDDDAGAGQKKCSLDYMLARRFYEDQADQTEWAQAQIIFGDGLKELAVIPPKEAYLVTTPIGLFAVNPDAKKRGGIKKLLAQTEAFSKLERKAAARVRQEEARKRRYADITGGLGREELDELVLRSLGADNRLDALEKELHKMKAAGRAEGGPVERLAANLKRLKQGMN